jgi:hypothetical protein
MKTCGCCMNVGDGPACVHCGEASWFASSVAEPALALVSAEPEPEEPPPFVDPAEPFPPPAPLPRKRGKRN